MELDNQLKLLKACLEQTALPYEQQLTKLKGSVVEDEILLDFSAGFVLLPNLVEAGQLSFQAIAAILRVNNRMENCINNVGMDSFGGHEWNEVRELATIALKELEISSGLQI
jgi:hypothetical protein